MQDLVFVLLFCLSGFFFALALILVKSDRVGYIEARRITGGVSNAVFGNVMVPHGDERGSKGMVTDHKNKKILPQGTLSDDLLDSVIGR